jgi:uncharacterized protein (DUF1800 family)
MTNDSADATAPTAELNPVPGLASASALMVSLALSACGGGGGGGGGEAAPAAGGGPAAAPTRAQAARFLAQASLSAKAAETTQVQAVGYSAWLDDAMAQPRSSSHVEWLRSKGYDALSYKTSIAGADHMMWRKLLSSPDPLRQRVTLALSEIFVISPVGIARTPFRQFAAAAFVDILEANAFGNFRTLLEQVSTSVAMGGYLTFKGSVKANPATNSLPDENYAREVMQLFTIGLVMLNADGTPLLDASGRTQDTYLLEDVSQLARVFTGWNIDTGRGTADTPDRSIAPMVQIASRHETGTKSFLGTVIPAGTDGANSLRLALDTLFMHPNVGPFIGRQLIQRLVTSDPTPAYVARVSAAFANNGAGVRGDLRAVLRAVLLDPEARGDAGLSDPAFGKLREPMLRFVQWARTFGIADATDTWRLGDLSDPATRLGQSPLRSPSVFNFFRPGYVPPNSGIGARTVPEFQITTESSVAGYVNFMQAVIGNAAFNGTTVSYAGLPLAADAAALLTELNLLLAAGQLSAPTLTALQAALTSISSATANGSTNRLKAALLLVMASPEYLTLK